MDEAPPSLQSYRYTPRSAAKITPRGLRGARASSTASTPADEADEQDLAGAVSPGTDSFSVRSHKSLDLSMATEDIFAAESKVFEPEDREEIALDAVPGPSGAFLLPPPARASPQQRARAGSLAASKALEGSGSDGGQVETKGQPSSFRGGRPPVLSNPGYRTEPPLELLKTWGPEQLRRVKGFKVIRDGFGEIAWEGEVDVTDVDLDQAVSIEKKEVRVYGDKDTDPGQQVPLGHKLNNPAVVTLERVVSKKKAPEEFKGRLQELIREWDGARFVSYDTATGRWQFRVAHFSRYAVDDDDSDDELPSQPSAAAKPASALLSRCNPTMKLVNRWDIGPSVHT
jgi:nuclear pore complex protein Nup98-Nup96